MADLSVDQWKAFLNARLTQEAGDDQKALEILDKLAVVHPNNPHIQSARAFALVRLNRSDEAKVARISAAYAKTAATLVGDADKPEAWTSELKSLLGELESTEKSALFASQAVAW